MEHIVVIGAGQAGSSLVGTLRAEGFEGEITLFGEEHHLPYQRPPLSKAYLLGDMERERLLLRNQAFYDDNNITLRLGAPVTQIDPVGKSLHCAGEEVSYDKLALTFGLRPRRLPAPVSAARRPWRWTIRRRLPVRRPNHQGQGPHPLWR